MGLFDAVKSGLGGFLAGGPLGAGLAIGGSLLGSYQQGKADKKNYQAQLAQQQMMQQMIGGQMQNGPNPYAQQLAGMQFNPQQYQASQIGMPDALSFLTVNAPGQGQQFSPVGTQGVDAQQINPMFGAQQIGAPGQVGVPLIQGPQMGSDFNMGQDALMQMLRSNPAGQRDRGMERELRSLYGDGGMQDLSALFAAQQPGQNKMLDQQVSALRGGAGSLGQRFGSGLRKDEAALRGDFMNNVNLNQQTALSSAFEQAQGRRLQALGLGSQNINARNQLGLQGQANQQGAAQQLMAMALQQAQLGQSAQSQNASNLLQAQGINVNAGLQAAQANQSAGLQAQGQNLQALLANQSAGLQAGQFNAGNALQAALAAQGFNFQGQQLNQQQQMQAQLANQSAGIQTGQFNAAQMMQALMANQGAMNQAGQFNATQGMNAQQMMMQALGQAGQLQQGQQGQNNQLMAMLAGLGVPQQQPGQLGNTIADIGQLSMLLPYLNKKPAAQSASTFAMPQLNFPMNFNQQLFK